MWLPPQETLLPFESHRLGCRAQQIQGNVRAESLARLPPTEEPSVPVCTSSCLSTSSPTLPTQESLIQLVEPGTPTFPTQGPRARPFLTLPRVPRQISAASHPPPRGSPSPPASQPGLSRAGQPHLQARPSPFQSDPQPALHTPGRWGFLAEGSAASDPCQPGAEGGELA